MMPARSISHGGSSPAGSMRRGRRGLILGGLALAATAPLTRTVQAAAVEVPPTKVEASFSLKVGASHSATPTIEIGPFERLHEISTHRGLAGDGRTIVAGKFDEPTITLNGREAMTPTLKAWFDDGEKLRAQSPGSQRQSDPTHQGLLDAKLVINSADGESNWTYELGDAWVVALDRRNVGGQTVVASLTISATSIQLKAYQESDYVKQTDSKPNELRPDTLR